MSYGIYFEKKNQKLFHSFPFSNQLPTEPKSVPAVVDVFCADEHTDSTYCHTFSHTSHKGSGLKISRIETPFQVCLTVVSPLDTNSTSIVTIER